MSLFEITHKKVTEAQMDYIEGLAEELDLSSDEVLAVANEANNSTINDLDNLSLEQASETIKRLKDMRDER